MTVSPVLRVAALTVVLATAACGGQDDGRAVNAAASSTAASSTAASSAAASSAASSAGAKATASASATAGSTTKGSGTAGPRLETSMPRATPSKTSPRKSTAKPTAPNTSQLRKNVSAPQRKYVSRNADPGIDAEAILQSGEDACERMSIAAAASGTTAVAVALVSGQIRNGREAIRYLCPQLKPALDQAAGGFPDGTYVVGSRLRAGREVPAGRYTVPQPPPGCVWSVTRPDGTVVAESKGGTRTGVTLKPPQRLSSTGCVAWLHS